MRLLYGCPASAKRDPLEHKDEHAIRNKSTKPSSFSGRCCKNTDQGRDTKVLYSGEVSMGKFLVIDTETTWSNRLMSLGAVVADADTMQLIGHKYYILDPEYRDGGMYSCALLHRKAGKPSVCSREFAILDLQNYCSHYKIEKIFAYNARFDKGQLPEFSHMAWHDIMQLAAYIQYNHAIPSNAAICSTGRLKCGYGVEPIMRLLSNDYSYMETHNALLDAADELEIMRLLGYSVDRYKPI